MKQGLEGLHAVSGVAFDPRSDTFVISATSDVVPEEIRRAVLRLVIFPRLRRFLGSLRGLTKAL